MKTVLDLFSGIGGFSLAARRAGFEVVAHCEIDQFPKAVLTHRFFNTPIFDDIKDINKRTFHAKTKLEKIDIVVGGSLYNRDHNREHLVDIANLAMIEFATHPDYPFNATDDTEHAARKKIKKMSEES